MNTVSITARRSSALAAYALRVLNASIAVRGFGHQLTADDLKSGGADHDIDVLIDALNALRGGGGTLLRFATEFWRIHEPDYTHNEEDRTQYCDLADCARVIIANHAPHGDKP